MELVHPPAPCPHTTCNQLFICDSEGCFSSLSKVFVCNVCCFNHNHGLHNLLKPSPFEKHCYQLQPLCSLKGELVSEIKAKFALMREEIVKNLTIKEEFLIQKLEEIFPKEVAQVVGQAMIKGKIQKRYEQQPFQIVKQIDDVEATQAILLECRKIVREFELDEAFLFKNNIFDLGWEDENDEEEMSREIQEEVCQEQKEHSQLRHQHFQVLPPNHPNQKPESTSEESHKAITISPQAPLPTTQSHSNPAPPIIPMIQQPAPSSSPYPSPTPTKTQKYTCPSKSKFSSTQKDPKQNNSKILINLEEVNVPIDIMARSFDDAATTLRDNVLSTDITIFVQRDERAARWDEDEREHTIKRFLQSLVKMTRLEKLAMYVAESYVLSLDNLIDFELAITSLERLKEFTATYFVEDSQCCSFEYSSLRNRIGAGNVRVVSQMGGSTD